MWSRSRASSDAHRWQWPGGWCLTNPIRPAEPLNATSRAAVIMHNARANLEARMQFPNPPAADGYYWIDILSESESRCIGHWRASAAGWACGPWSTPFADANQVAVRSERIVFAEPAPPAAEAAPAAPPAPRPAGSAAPNTAIDAIVAEVMARAVNQEIAALAVAMVTSEDMILTDQAANPHMGSRLLAGAALLQAKVLRAVEREAARMTA